MTPDMPTLFAVGATICGLAACLQLLISMKRKVPTLKLWAAANFAFSLGCSLFTARPFLPLYVTVILGNGVFIFGTALLALGIEAFRGGRLRPGVVLIGPALAMACLAASLASGDRPAERAIIVAVSLGLYIGWAAVALLRLSHRRTIGTRVACATVMLAFVVLYGIWAVGMYLGWAGRSGILGGATHIVALALASMWSICSIVLSLDRMAMVDDLTGVPNRRATMIHGDWAVRETARKPERSLSVFMVDFDYFKQVNDRFGHNVGDAVLQAFAAIATSTLRADDFIGRLGGEEFCVILPGTDRQQALDAAERLRANCERGLARVADLPTDVTISIGIVAPSAAIPDFAALMLAADRALYGAKALGRNRIVFADGMERHAALQTREAAMPSS